MSTLSLLPLDTNLVSSELACFSLAKNINNSLVEVIVKMIPGHCHGKCIGTLEETLYFSCADNFEARFLSFAFLVKPSRILTLVRNIRFQKLKHCSLCVHPLKKSNRLFSANTFDSTVCL